MRVSILSAFLITALTTTAYAQNPPSPFGQASAPLTSEELNEIKREQEAQRRARNEEARKRKEAREAAAREKAEKEAIESKPVAAPEPVAMPEPAPMPADTVTSPDAMPDVELDPMPPVTTEPHDPGSIMPTIDESLPGMSGSGVSVPNPDEIPGVSSPSDDMMGLPATEPAMPDLLPEEMAPDSNHDIGMPPVKP